MIRRGIEDGEGKERGRRGEDRNERNKEGIWIILESYMDILKIILD